MSVRKCHRLKVLVMIVINAAGFCSRPVFFVDSRLRSLELTAMSGRLAPLMPSIENRVKILQRHQK
jgi:hypothetical protein